MLQTTPHTLDALIVEKLVPSERIYKLSYISGKFSFQGLNFRYHRPCKRIFVVLFSLYTMSISRVSWRFGALQIIMVTSAYDNSKTAAIFHFARTCFTLPGIEIMSSMA